MYIIRHETVSTASPSTIQKPSQLSLIFLSQVFISSPILSAFLPNQTKKSPHNFSGTFSLKVFGDTFLHLLLLSCTDIVIVIVGSKIRIFFITSKIIINFGILFYFLIQTQQLKKAWVNMVFVFCIMSSGSHMIHI